MVSMFFRYVMVLGINLCLNFYIHGQDCNLVLKGQVNDAHDYLKLEYVSVFIEELQKETFTEDNGAFIFENICPGNYHMVFSHLGSRPVKVFLELKQDTALNVVLEHHEGLLEEVMIEAKGSQNKTGLSKSVISKDMMVEMSGRNLTEMLAAIPGVSILKSGPNLTKPIINGLYGQRITILNHGIPQEGQQWGNDHAPEIDPNTADKLSVYKGSSAVKYGLSTLGGLIVIESNDLNYDPHWHGDVKLSGQSNGRSYGLNATLRKSTKWGNTRWSAGFAKGGDRHTPDYYLTNTGNNEKSASLLWSNDQTSKAYRKLYYSFYQNEIGILRGSHIGNLTDLQAAIGRDKPFFTRDTFDYTINAPRQLVSHHLLKFNQKYVFSESLSINLDAGFQANLREEYDVRRGGRSSRPSLDMALLSQFLDIQGTRQGTQVDQSTSMGIQYKIISNTNQPGTGINPLIPNYLNHQLASYLIHKDKWKSIFFEIGMRAEYRNYHVYRSENRGGGALHQYFNIAGNVGFRKNINKYIHTTLDVSYTGRPPEINELYSLGLHQGVSGIEEGNENLNPEHALKVVHEWNGHLTRHHHLNLSVFYNRFTNFIYLQPSNEFRLTIRGAFTLYKYVGADVDMFGVSAKSNLEIIEHLNWSNSIQYTYGQNLSLGQGLIRIPPLNAVSNLSFTLNKSSWYEEIKFATELSYTAMQNRVNPAEDFLLPPDDYFLCNAWVKIKWKTKTKNEVNFISRIDNLFNATYRDYLNRLRYFADELGRNISLSLNMSF
jgi:iron complex outermembrane receptor protein